MIKKHHTHDHTELIKLACIAKGSTVPILVDQIAVAILLGTSTAKLERDRWSGNGIRFRKCGTAVRYDLRDVVAHIEAQPLRSCT